MKLWSQRGKLTESKFHISCSLRSFTCEFARYERMDEHSPSAFGKLPQKQRMEVPEGSVVSRPHLWGPYFLGIYDLGSIIRTNSLFIRKVSVQIDPNIVNLFPVDSLSMLPEIDWPEQIEISEKPNFKY